MWQNIIVFIILAVTIFFVLRSIWRIAKTSSPISCGCEGCSGCTELKIKTKHPEKTDTDHISCPQSKSHDSARD